jgi:hypothetical protein
MLFAVPHGRLHRYSYPEVLIQTNRIQVQFHFRIRMIPENQISEEYSGEPDTGVIVVDLAND